ncbi:hypothetical protein MUG91_G122n31 [Manis pentadactyla]|nr:hypothetical protein MUG91_G122n31 [Manis pentadactyla]
MDGLGELKGTLEEWDQADPQDSRDPPAGRFEATRCMKSHRLLVLLLHGISHHAHSTCELLLARKIKSVHFPWN